MISNQILQNTIEGLKGITPVSYTHLDVYKRQDQIYTPEGLIERYHSQLDYYAKALEQLTQKKVKEKIIYSFTIKKEIRLP